MAQIESPQESYELLNASQFTYNEERSLHSDGIDGINGVNGIDGINGINGKVESNDEDEDTAGHDTVLYTPDEEQAVLRKLDRRLVLFMALMYLLSFLDRSNIGNARIAGLTGDLSLSSGQYEWLLTAFYLSYILFQWMTLLYHVIPAHIYMSLCVLSWSIIASLQAVVPNFASLLVLRFLLGIGEAAFSPGAPFLLSFFFRRDELALRIGLFISAAPLATSLASSLAWVIVRFGEAGPIASWRLLFLVEGFPSIVVSVLAWYQIPDSPETARWLSRREKRVAGLRLKRERMADVGAGNTKGLDWREIGGALVDPKLFLTAGMMFCCNVAFSSLPPFLPTIIHEMKYSTLTSQALSAPPYLFSFFAIILTAYLSDRSRLRAPFLIFHALLASVGYLFLSVAGYFHLPSFYRYLGVFPASIGFFSAVTLIITWTLNNQDSASKRGTGVALLNVVGQCGPLIGTRLYPDHDKPYYVRGMAICAGFMAATAVLAAVLRAVLARDNGRVEDGNVEEVGLVNEERKKRFVYIL